MAGPLSPSPNTGRHLPLASSSLDIDTPSVSTRSMARSRSSLTLTNSDSSGKPRSTTSNLQRPAKRVRSKLNVLAEDTPVASDKESPFSSTTSTPSASTRSSSRLKAISADTRILGSSRTLRSLASEALEKKPKVKRQPLLESKGMDNMMATTEAILELGKGVKRKAMDTETSTDMDKSKEKASHKEEKNGRVMKRPKTMVASDGPLPKKGSSGSLRGEMPTATSSNLSATRDLSSRVLAPEDKPITDKAAAIPTTAPVKLSTSESFIPDLADSDDDLASPDIATHEESEEDEPLPSKFASLRHRPPTPPRVWDLKDRRKSMGMDLDPLEGKHEEDVEMSRPTKGDYESTVDQDGNLGTKGGTTPSITPPRLSVHDSPMILDTPPTDPSSTTPRQSPVSQAVTTTPPHAPPATPSRFASSLPVQASPFRAVGGISRFGTPKKPITPPRLASVSELSVSSETSLTQPSTTQDEPGRATQESHVVNVIPKVRTFSQVDRQKIPPPKLPARTLRSSASTRTLGRTDPAPSSFARATDAALDTTVRVAPSRIPRSTTLYSSTISSAAKTSDPPSGLPGHRLGGVSGHSKRPQLGDVRRPTLRATASTSSSTTPAQRKPSYPSSLSLGSGAPPSRPAGVGIGRPRDRTVSVPVPASVLASFRSDGPGMDDVDGHLAGAGAERGGVEIISALKSPTERFRDGSVDGRGQGGLGLGAPGGKGFNGSPTRRSISAPVRPSASRLDQDGSLRQGEGESTGLSISQRRAGAGWNDTSQSFAGLAAALERLKRKDSLVGKGVRASLGVGMGSGSTVPASGQDDTMGESLANHQADETAIQDEPTVISDRLAAVHRPRHSIAVSAMTPASTSSLGQTMPASTSTNMRKSLSLDRIEGADATKEISKNSTIGASTTSKCLRGVVAFVDTATEDGTDTSAHYREMLKDLGARVLARPSDSITHIIYKSGRPSTLAWYRKQCNLITEAEDEKRMIEAQEAELGPNEAEAGRAEREPIKQRPHVLGIKWIIKCKAEGKRVEEQGFEVDVKSEGVFGKARKSMEPKALSLAGRLSTTPTARKPLSALAQLAEARRKAALYTPTVGSPLKRAYNAN